MSELIKYADIEGAFRDYFEQHEAVFTAFFNSLENLIGVDECRFIVFPEQMYDKFPAAVLFLDATGKRLFDDSLQDSVLKALREISYLPNIVEYDEVDPEVYNVEFADGSVVGVFPVVLDLVRVSLAKLLPSEQKLRSSICLNDQEPIRIQADSE